MRQSRVQEVHPNPQPSNKVSVESFLDICQRMLSLCQHFPKESKAFEAVETSGETLKRLKSFLQDIKRNQENLEGLKEKLAKSLEIIKSHIFDLKESQVPEAQEKIQALEDILNNYSFLETDAGSFPPHKQAFRPGAGQLHSLRFSRIVTIINAASANEPEWMSRTGTLLILDSNPNTSQALKRRLTREGHTIQMAENESQALEILQSDTIELILVDYLVFQDNLGLFLEKIERELSIGYVPVIVIGASENAEGMQPIIEAGIGDYLAKPVNPILLKARVRSALEKKHAFEERVKRQEELKRARLELETDIQGLSDGFAVFDKDHQMVMHNNKLLEYYPGLENGKADSGLTFESFLEANVAADLYAFTDLREKAKQKWVEEKKANFLRPASQWEESFKNGRILSITTYRTPDGGGALIAKDVSQDKIRHQDLTFLAYHDSLTGLANRKSFYQRLTESIAMNSKEHRHDYLAVLFLDLDGFKAINDTHGHEMGDWLLTQVAQRLYRSVRGEDLVARIGGDEFSIILNHVPTRNKVKIITQRILKSISEPYTRQDTTVTIGASIGISVYSPRTSDGKGLMDEADKAMYAVKKRGKGHFRFFDDLRNPLYTFEAKLEKPKPAKA